MASVSNLEFDLDQVKGKVATCEVKIPTLQTAVVKGLTMVTGQKKHVHVLVEPSPKSTSVFVLGNTSELKPGGSDVTVVLSNLSRLDVTLELHTEIGTVAATNIVPSMQVGNEPKLDETERLSCVSAQIESTDLPEKFQQRGRDSGGILFDLSGIDEWEPQIQQKLRPNT